MRYLSRFFSAHTCLVGGLNPLSATILTLNDSYTLQEADTFN
jgi:hypothetical protein